MAASNSLNKTSDFQREFDRLQQGGFIGDPQGKPAYAYLRVSSDEQGESGRSGLPRQLEYCHEIAKRQGYRIPRELILAEDYSGFVLERPELDKLRREYRTPQRSADVVIYEDIDRLSRNSTWHQGYLLNEMEQYGVTPVFWKEVASMLELKLRGIIAHEAMMQAKQRMAHGNVKKAESGRVTARKPAFGYQFVDSQGNVGEHAKRDTHYGVYLPESVIVEEIYRRVASAESLRSICKDFIARQLPPPRRYKTWNISFLTRTLKNTVYRGEFVAQRTRQFNKKTGNGYRKQTEHGYEFVTRNTLRDEAEWIRVSVPAIVSDDLWQRANDILDRNKEFASRNQKYEYLLTGFLRCSECGLAFHAFTNPAHPETQRYYRCTGAKRHDVVCSQTTNINCNILDKVVWSVVFNMLFTPEVLIRSLDERLNGENNMSLIAQRDYLESELAKFKSDDEKLSRAYMAGAFDEFEYAERRNALKQRRTHLESELNLLLPRVWTPEQIDAAKREIVELCTAVRAMTKTPDDVPELDLQRKRQILRQVIREIRVDANNCRIEFDGELSATSFTWQSSDFVTRSGNERVSLAQITAKG